MEDEGEAGSRPPTRSGPYVKRAMEDPELREDLLAAFVAARSLYGQIAKSDGVKGKAEKVSEKDFQKELQELVSEVSDAADRLEGHEGAQDAQPRDPAHGRDARRALQPVDGPGDARWIMTRVSRATATGSRSSPTSSPRRPATARAAGRVESRT